MGTIAIGLVGMMLLATPDPARTTRLETTWCHVFSTPTDATPYRDARFRFVRREALDEAFDLVETRPAAPLSGEALRHFLDGEEIDAGKRYYLVRGAIYAPPGAGLHQAYDYVPSAYYELDFTPDGVAVVVASQRAFAREVAAQNVPLILETSAEVSRLVVVCVYFP